MILSYKITVEELSKAGKNHKWERHFCENCGCFMWGHGFVTRYFQSIESYVYLKRYRCPKCTCVTTARPDEYWPVIRSSIRCIFNILKTRITTGVWPPSFPRQRGGHWLKRFVNHAKMSGDSWLRLNQSGAFTSGTHTPYNLNASGITTGSLYSDPGFGNIQAQGFIKPGQVVVGVACPALGAQGFDGATGAPAYCNNFGVWASSAGGKAWTTVIQCGGAIAGCPGGWTQYYQFGSPAGLSNCGTQTHTVCYKDF